MAEQKPKRQPSLESNAIYGKVPPQARDLEVVVLGACMLIRGTVDIVAETLKPESFYVDAHQRIFRAILQLNAASSPIDEIIVAQQLLKNKELELIGGPYYLTKLTKEVVSNAHIEHHCKIILEKYVAREVIRIAGELIGKAYDDSTDVFDLMSEAEASVGSVSTSLHKTDFSHITSGLMQVTKEVEELKHQKDSFSGVPTGFKDLNAKTHGWQKTDLIILAARPAVGKTAMALNLARNAAMDLYKPTPVGFFSLEMSNKQLTQRLLSTESEVWLERIRTGKLEDDVLNKQFYDGVSKLSKAPIYIDDTPGLNVFEFRAKARRMIQKHKVGLLMVDYLQLMSDGSTNRNKNRENEISMISRTLKKIAKELEVPIIALSQLSREIEKRPKGQRFGQLSDLRESGAIEQDADMVAFIYKYSEDEWKDNVELKDVGGLSIAKNRHGRLGRIEMKFYGEIQLWLSKEDAAIYEGRRDPEPAIQNNLFTNVQAPIIDKDEDMPF